MRVVRSSVYRRYTSSLNDLQSNLNKSMNKVSTGAAYETAADNPLVHLLYRDVFTKRFKMAVRPAKKRSRNGY